MRGERGGIAANGLAAVLPACHGATMNGLSANRHLLGIGFLCLGIAIFSLQDAVIKLVSGDYPVTQIVFIRAVTGIPLLLAFVHFEAGIGALMTRRFWLLIVRAALLLCAYTSYYLAFPVLPLADAVALFFMAPVFVTVLSIPILGETIRPMVWLAIALGFAGVVIMMKPFQSGFEPAALLSLMSAVFYAVSMVMARKLGAEESASVMAFYANWIYLLGAGLAALIFFTAGITEAAHPSLNFLVKPWQQPNLGDLLLMASCGVIAAIAGSLLTAAYRVTEANRVAVFEYTGLFWTPLWGFLFFAEVPAFSTVAGALLIVGAGLLTLSPSPVRQLVSTHYSSSGTRSNRAGRLIQIRQSNLRKQL
jgi:drug/metabolite transporter (DMT)-like permease